MPSFNDRFFFPERWRQLQSLLAGWGLIALSLLLPAAAFAGEQVLDTGAIKLSLGKTAAGFIDEAYLDRNGDGIYTPDELIVRQAENEPAIVVSYIKGEPYQAADGIATGHLIQGRATVDRVEAHALSATIRGTLHFDGYDSTPFEIEIRGRKNSAALKVDFSFVPLKNIPGLSLKEASLRLYGVFDQRDPKVSRRSMSTGDFRNTPRPDSSYQPLVWQLGGHLVESPWYWRNWLSWSESTGPVTVREGAAPPRDLSFFMRDDRQGIQASILEPAGVAPVELSGIGLPSNLGIFAWSPRVPPLPMHANLPARFELKNIGLHFFRVDVEGLPSSGNPYWKKVDEIVSASRQELEREQKPAQSTLHVPRLPTEMIQKRLDDLAASPSRGWDANVLHTRLPERAPPHAADSKASGEGWVALQVDQAGSDTTGLPLPVSGGIPFPRGALQTTEHLRLLDADGQEIPIQADKLATWPDGSVKWVLITFLADGAKTPPLRLEYGPRITRQAPAFKKLTITRNADGLDIDTGALRFSLSKKSADLFGELWLKAPGQEGAEKQMTRAVSAKDRANRMDLLALASPEGYAPYAFHAEGAQPEPSRAEIEDISIERAGPLSAHLLVKGRYHYETLGRGRGKTYRNEGNEFWIRYTVYAGQPYVEVKHSFVFEGNPDIEMIRDLSLSAWTTVAGEQTVTIGADGQTMIPFPADQAGVFQDNPSAAEIWSAGKSTAGEHIRKMASIADGWIDVSEDNKQGVTFGMRNMREMYAKELSVDGERLTVSLWPRRARLLDTRRYSRQYGDGESTSFGQGTAQGVSRTHDLFFYFHAGDAVAAASAGVARKLLQPAILKAPPAWYANSRAAGDFRQQEARQNVAWEQMITDGIDYFLYHRQLWSWFGIYDYGDFQQVPDSHGGWARLDGRWGWANNEALIDMFLYEQFMRTGTKDYLEAALAMTRHTQEVDLINSDDYKDNHTVKMQGHRHNVNHWGDGYVGIRVAAPQGFRLGYFLTGDLRIYDQLRMGMDAHWQSTHAYDKEHSSGLGYLTFFWEATGDDVYRNALNGYLDFQTGHFKKFGNIHSDVWNFRKDVGRALPDAPLSGAPTSFFFQNFGAAYSLMELAELTGRADLIEALVQFARDTMQQRGNTWEALFCHYRLMAFAYRHTGDPEFLRYATEHADKLGVSPDRKTWAQGSAINRFDNKVSMLAWAGQGLPYLMLAIDARSRDPLVAFTVPSILPMPKGKTSASLQVDGSATRPREGAIASYEWLVDGTTASSDLRATLALPPGKHQISLRASDRLGRSAIATKTLTVWEPGVITRLCFRGRIDGFVGGEYSDAKGYGFTRGTRIVDTSEPRRQGGKGCPEVHITGGVRVRADPGQYIVEMGGTDFWTESMGRISLQQRSLDTKVTKEATKKLSWSFTGDATVGADGMLNIDFIPGPNGEPVVLAYIIVREKR